MSVTVTPDVLTLACSSLPAPPLFWTDPDGSRHGYEPDAAEAVAAAAGLEVRWIFTQWSAMRPALEAGECDAIWCGSAITEERLRVFDYTRPYAVFDESVLVRADAPVAGPADLDGLRVGAIAASTNMALAETFPGAVTVPFDGATDDVLGDMIAALRAGDVDAVVDDDVAFLGLEDPGVRVAFTVETRNRWGAACRKGNGDLVALLDDAIAAADLRSVWERWLPGLGYPLG